jgi:hypothetical protein
MMRSMSTLGKHLRPWRRGPYTLILSTFLITLVAFVAVAAAVVMAFGGSDDPPMGFICGLLGVGVLLVILSLPLVVSRLRGRRRAAPTVAHNDDAIALLRAGRYDEAATLFEDLCHASRHAPALHALYVLNYGVAQLHRGRPDEAVEVIEAARASGWFAPGAQLAHLGPAAEVSLALACAVRDERGRAAGLVESLNARLGEPRAGQTLLVQAVLAAREGRALELDEARQRAAEAVLMPAHVRALRVLEAFVRRGGDGSAYRRPGEGDAERALAYRGELDFLAARWPELRTFLESRGLAGRGSAGSAGPGET